MEPISVRVDSGEVNHVLKKWCEEGTLFLEIIAGLVPLCGVIAERLLR